MPWRPPTTRTGSPYQACAGSDAELLRAVDCSWSPRGLIPQSMMLQPHARRDAGRVEIEKCHDTRELFGVVQDGLHFVKTEQQASVNACALA
eukprot:10813207-Lingulodinium_polyedra.AAC.1